MAGKHQKKIKIVYKLKLLGLGFCVFSILSHYNDNNYYYQICKNLSLHSHPDIETRIKKVRLKKENNKNKSDLLISNVPQCFSVLTYSTVNLTNNSVPSC